MTRGNMTRVWLAVLGAALAVSGCRCGPQPDECTPMTVSFLQPADKDQVGLTLTVDARATANATGAVVVMEKATLESMGPGEGDFGHAIDGVLVDGKAEFAGLTLPAGDNSLRVTALEKGTTACKANASITVTAKDNAAPPRVTQVSFPQDLNKDGVLNAAELGLGEQIRMQVSVANGSATTVQAKQGADVVGAAVAVLGGGATVVLDQLAVADSATYELFAEVLKGGAAVNTPAGNPEALATIRVARVVPQCANTTKALLGPSDDADSAKAGFQLRGTGTVGSSVVSAVFRIVGLGDSEIATPAAGKVSGDLTVPATGDISYAVVMEAKDAQGNPCRDSKTVEVDLVKPVVAITSPALQADGGVPTIALTPLTITATVSGVADGTSICAYRKGATGPRQQVDCSAVSSGTVTMTMPFGQNGDFELSVDAIDAAGNVGTTTINVHVALTVCPLAFTKPTSCPAYVSSKDLVGGAYPAELESAGCVGKTVTVFAGAATVPACTGVVGSNGRFQCPVPMVSAGTLTLHGEVANQIGAATAVGCDVVFDPTTPTIVVPATPTTGPAILNASADSQSSLAGAQAALQFNASVPTGGRVDVCMNASSGSTGQACPTGQTGWFLLKSNVTSPTVAFTFPEGEYQLKLAVVANGSWNESAPLPMRVDVTAPCVTSAGVALPQDGNADKKLNIAELAGAAPKVKFFLGAACADLAAAPPQTVLVKEVVGGTVAGTALNLAADVTRGTVSDVTVNLTQGVQPQADMTLFVELTDWVGNKNGYLVGGVDSIAMSVDTVAPTCTITQPSKTGTLNIADLTAGNLAVSVATSADGLAVPMTFSNGGTPTAKTGSAPAAPSYESSTTFTPTGDATWTLAATCADVAGNTTPATKSWRIDTVLPVPTITAPTSGVTLTTFGPTATATVSGADGQTICFFGTGPVSGEVALGCGPVTSGAASVVLNFSKNGTWAVVARVSSAGGNAAQSAAVTGVVINSPLCPATLTVPALVNASMVVGGNYTVNGSTTCLGVNTTLKVNAVAAGAVVSSGAGAAQFAVPVTNGSTYVFEFCVKNTGVNPDSCTSATTTVDTVAPACAIALPIKTGVLNVADLTAGALAVGVTTSADGLPVSMTFSSGATTSTKAGSTPASPSYQSNTTFAPTGDANWTLAATCTDLAGNTATVSRTWQIDLVPPTVIITSPVAGGPTIQFTPRTVSATFVGVAAGAQACFFRKALAGARQQVGCATVVAGGASLSIPFTQNDTYELSVDVSDAAGNVGTAAVSAVVSLYVCPTAFSRPSQCPAYLTTASLSNGVYSFATANGSCTGNTARFSMTPYLADGGVGTTSTPCTGNVTATGVFACDVPLTDGNYTASAAVDNQVGSPSTANCTVTVNTGAPVITSPAMGGGGVVPATINVAQDTQPGVAGAQRLFQFNALKPLGGSFDVCTTQQTDPVTAVNRLACSDGVSGWYQMQSNVSSPVPGLTFSEGSYQIKLVVLNSGAVAVDSSPPVSVFVDVTPPCVLAASLRLPQDTGADGALNAVELGATPPQVAFKLGCGDTVATLSATDPVSLREVLSGALTATRYNAVLGFTQAAGEITIPTNIAAPIEKNFTFFVRLTDLAGNTNPYVSPSDAAYKAVRIDTVAPSCTVTQPTVSQTILGIAGVPGGNLAVSVDTSVDVGTNGVATSLVGPSTINHTATPSGAQNTATSSFAVTGTASWTLGAICTDGVGNATTVPGRAITIDLDAPTCTIAAPTNAALYLTSLITTTVNVTGAEGRPVSITSSLQVPPLGTLSVASGVAQGSLSYSDGTQTVTATVSDAAGNSCSSTVTGVRVASGSCPLVATGVNANAAGNWLNRNNTTTTGPTTATATFAANSSSCNAGQTVTLARVLPTAATIGSMGTDASGNVSFAGISVADGESYTLTIANGTAPQTVLVDLVAPTAGTAAPAPFDAVSINTQTLATAAAASFFVAPADNENVRTAVAGYFADKNGASVGAQFDLALNAVVGGKSGANYGSVNVTFKGASIGSQVLTADPQASVAFAGLTLPHNDIGTLAITVTDPAGNMTTVYSATATIDVIAPAAPTYTPSFNTVLDPQAKRKGLVELTWAPTYDDAATAGTGAHAGYDVRWTTSSVINNNGMALFTDYFGGASNPEANVAWSASSITRQYKLPPINTYYIVVRARDEVGNYSAYPAVVPSLANPWNNITISNPTGLTTQAFGQMLATGVSLNSDSIEDLVVASPSKAPGGSVYVFYGKTGFGPSGPCVLPDCQEITPYDGAAGLFGTDLSVTGNAGDVSGENKPDLVIAQPTFAAAGVANSGRAFLYFGSSTGSLETRAMDLTGPPVVANGFIEFRCVAQSRFGSAARILRDINGDGIDDLAITAHGDLSNQGRVYIFRGRSASAWDTARTATAGTSKYVPCADADWKLDGPAAIATGGNEFARLRYGITTLGNVKGDISDAGLPMFDFGIPSSKESTTPVSASLNKYWLYSAATVVDGGSTPLATTYVRRVDPPPVIGASTTTDAFGRSAWGGLDFTGGAGFDVVIGYALQNRLHLFVNLTSADFDPANSGVRSSSLITGATGSYFGYTLSGGDLNGDGAADIVVGESPNTGILPIPGQAWVLFQRIPANDFDSTAGVAGGGFWTADLRNMTAGNRMGRIVAVGDVTNDGAKELLLGDEVSNNVKMWSWQ